VITGAINALITMKNNDKMKKEMKEKEKKEREKQQQSSYHVQSNSALSPGETSFPHASTMRSSFASD
jgi:hypothetical protein